MSEKVYCSSNYSFFLGYWWIVWWNRNQSSCWRWSYCWR